MSHGLVKKIDRIVAKLASKHKENKAFEHDLIENGNHHDENLSDRSAESHHNESILQRMKDHFSHTLSKNDNHQQEQQQQLDKHEKQEAQTKPTRPDGVPPSHVIVDDLQGSPFEG